jgi:hypothetical protein
VPSYNSRIQTPKSLSGSLGGMFEQLDAQISEIDVIDGINMHNLTANNASYVKDMDELKITVAQHMEHINTL